MVEIGSVINATISRIEPYGVFLLYEGEGVFVDAANFCWTPDTNPVHDLKCGETIDVLVVRYNYEDQMIVGSFKHLRPESNPYRQLSRMPADTEFDSEVQYVHKDCVSVRLPNQAMGIIPKEQLRSDVHTGEQIRVRITSLEVDAGRLHVEPV